MSTPSDYGVTEHSTWNKYQEDSVEWGMDVDGIGILEAPPGSGKSCIAKAWSSTKSTIVLTRTKSLQDQYVDAYSATPLKGRGNYDCQLGDCTCEDCEFSDEGMNHCPVYHDCPYMVAKWTALRSKWTTLNYAYWLRARSFRDLPDHRVVLDECHTLSDTILDFVGLKMTERRRSRYGLPFPPIISGNGSSVLSSSSVKPTDRILDWLTLVEDELSRLSSYYEGIRDPTDSDKRRSREVDRLRHEIRTTKVSLDTSPSSWFVRSGPDAINGDPGLICRPLTARYHAPRYLFDGEGRTTVAMSATVGDFGTFCQELGVEEWIDRRVPNRFPVESRRVHVLDCPGIGQSTSFDGYEKQADEIARTIKDLPPKWSGLVLTTSKHKTSELYRRLQRRGLGRRLWTPRPMSGTDRQLNDWEWRRRRFPDSIAVTWGFWEGYDGQDEKFVICAKVPYGYLGDPYERARQRHDGKYYLLRTAQKLEQGLGRVRRSPADYNLGGEFRSYVAIADGNWKRVRKYLSQSLREAIIDG